MAEILLIQPLKLLCHIHISIEIDIAVGRMIIGAVEIQEFLIGQLRDKCRITAGILPITVVREQRLLGKAVKQTLRGGVSALHLIVHNAVVDQRRILRFQLVVPALLPENLFFFIDVGMQHGIHVNIHQVLKILFIAACHRIHGLIRIGHGI